MSPLNTSPNSTTTRRSALRVAGASALALTLGACATANGPAFTALQTPEAGKAKLYLYRKSAIYAIGAAYPVTHLATKEKLGDLVNASYLELTLPPGAHQISVDERGFAGAKTVDLTVEAGKTYFVEYDSSKGGWLGWGILSGSYAKTQAQALEDLKELKRAN